MREPLVLASASPRRAQILRSLGLAFRVVVSSVDEQLRDGEAPGDAALRLAVEKARDVARAEAHPVVAADTMVVIDGAMLGKPRSRDDAAEMIRRLAGREHEVVTGVCVLAGGRVHGGIERTVVRFAPMRDVEVAWCVATDEPMDKAGAYHVEGRAALFIEAIVGSPSNVAGLPVRLLYTLATQAGLSLVSELA
jgi:septum formation protein